jgi:pyruvate kinase
VAHPVDIALVSALLQEILERARDFESRYAEDLAAVHPRYRDSARNLVHYLALRKGDLRELQEDLATLGLSSLGQAERNVLASVGAVHSVLQQIARAAGNEAQPEPDALELRNRAAAENKRAILGDVPEGRDVSIMVTLPIEAGSNRALVAEMIEAGMNVARINCAHDDEDVWATMIDNVHKAADEAGTNCRIIMDLSGPKIRTGALRPGPRVFHIRPRRDPMGRTIAPRRIRFIPDDVVWRGTKVAIIPVPPECIEYAHEGDEIQFRDTRGKKRTLSVIQKDDKQGRLHCDRHEAAAESRRRGREAFLPCRRTAGNRATDSVAA